MSYEPLHHKYRPQIFADLVGQSAIATTLSSAIKQTKIAPAYLFTGPRGTGKTSSARILAKSLNCLSSDRPTPQPCGKCEVCKAISRGSALDVMEIDAASNTGVDNIREIIERCQFAPVQSRYKVYCVDECHMLSTAAFNALLKTLEEPPDRVVFVLATTDPQRVLSTIISRCQRFDFRRIPLADMVSHLKYIATQEKINITDEAITLVGQIANGGLRDAESLLDQLSLLPEIITVEQVWDLVGSVPEQDLLGLLEAIASNQPEQVIDRCRNLLDRGREPLVVLQNLAGFYLNLLIAQTAPHRSDLVAVTETTWQTLSNQAKQWNTQAILQGQQHLKEAEVQIKNTTQPRLWLEVTLLGLLPLSSSVNIEVQREQREVEFRVPESFVKLNKTETEHGQQSQVDQKTIPLKTKASEQFLAESTTKVKLPESIPVTTPQPSQPITSTDRLPSPQTSTSTPPPGNGITPNSEAVALGGFPDLSPKGLALRRKLPNPKGELQTPNSELSKVSPQELWKKAIEHLQPPTTQALFKQKCHLISLEGSVAIVGIISPQLLKLNQGKIPNLEAAFAKVCQRTIKVKLEVSTAELSSENPDSPSVQPPSVQASVSSPASNTSTTSSVESRASFTTTPEKKTLTLEKQTPPANNTTNYQQKIELNQFRDKAQTVKEKPEQVITVREPIEQKRSELEYLASNEDKPFLEESEISIPNSELEQVEDKLQKAIKNLAENFEGEVVTLTGTIDDDIDLEESQSHQLLDAKDNNSTLEQKPEKLSLQRAENNHQNSNINQSVPKTTPIVHNRPDLSKYEDENDVPF